jgi:rhamnose transport system permease protein
VVLRAREMSIVGALVVLVVVTTIVNPRFLSAQGIEDIFLNASILALLAVGQTMVVITRNIDLSVGSLVGLVAFVTGDFASGTDTNVLLVALLGVLIGTACGLVNGLLVSFCRVPALVVTLGTLYVIQGLDYYIASGDQISASELPSSVLSLGNDAVLGIPYLPIITVAVMLAIGFYLRSYSSGREYYAIGSSPEAARLAGVPIRRRVLTAYLVSGALAGLAGVLWLARFGTVLGALLITIIGSVLVVLKVNPFWQDAITGLLLLLAISVDRLLALRTTRALKARSRSRRGRRRFNGNGAAPPGAAANAGTGAGTGSGKAKEEGSDRDAV